MARFQNPMLKMLLHIFDNLHVDIDTSIYHQIQKIFLEETPNPKHVVVVVANPKVLTLLVLSPNGRRP